VKADRFIAIYHRMRKEPLWRLLASANGPIIIGLLQSHLFENERSLPASILHERIGRDLEALRAQGEDLPQSAQAYIAGWLSEGYLERRFPAGAVEEEYELSTAAVEAIRFLSGLEQPRSAATESRLALVIQALVKLAEDTDTNQTRRIERLEAEKARIEKEIEAIQNGQMRVTPNPSALEQTREIISLADELAGDFRRVRDQFEQLNRELRERLIDNEGSRGEVLESMFTVIDQINESEAGKTFSAFWRLLTDPEQSAVLDQALDNIMSREFFNQLELKDMRFLRRMTGNLLEQGGIVHKVLQDFARSLKHFVQSREYLEQRRLNQIIKDARHAAMAIKDEIKTTNTIKDLVLTSSRIRSLSQWTLYDPAIQALPREMNNGSTPDIDLDSVAELVVQSEIDFRTLKANIRGVLDRLSQASIHDVLEQYPAAQGLGSVVGLITLGSRYGIKSDNHETVSWIGNDSQQRSAKIPKIFFLRERMNELV
jgi:hypothetical protein